MKKKQKKTNSMSTIRRLSRILEGLLKENKVKTKEDFINYFKDQYTEEVLSEAWERRATINQIYDMVVNGASIKEIREKFKDIPRYKIIGFYSDAIRKLRKNDKSNTGGVTMADEKNLDLSEVTKEIMKNLSPKFDEIAKCIKEGTCSPEDIKNILSSSVLSEVKNLESKVNELYEVKEELNNLKDYFKNVVENATQHTHKTPQEALSCPTCGPILLEEAKKILSSQAEEEKGKTGEEKEETKEEPKKEEKQDQLSSMLEALTKKVEELDKKVENIAQPGSNDEKNKKTSFIDKLF